MAKKDRFYSEEEILRWFQRLQNKPEETNKKIQKDDLVNKKLNSYMISDVNEPSNSKEKKTSKTSPQKSKKSSKGHGKEPKKRKQSDGNHASTENHRGFGLIQGQTKTFHANKPSKKKSNKKKQQPLYEPRLQKPILPAPTVKRNRRKGLRYKKVVPYNKDSFVQDKLLGTFHRVLDCSAEIVTLHKNNKEILTLPICDALSRLRIVSNMHYGVQVKYWKKEKIRDKINDRSMLISTEIIKSSGLKLEEMSLLYPHIVPEILTPSEWKIWERRVQDYLHNPDSSSSSNNLINSDSKPTNSNSPPRTYRKTIIRPEYFIIKVHNFFCVNHGHDLETISARVFLRRSDHQGLDSLIIPAGYCKTCNLFYIHSDVYENNNLFRLPVTCEIIDVHDYQKYPNSHTSSYGNLARESLLRKCGYSVSVQDDPGDHARLQILLSIIDHGLMRKAEILSFLNWLIDKNCQQIKMQNALNSWRYDYKRLTNMGENRIVDVGTIKHK